MTVASHYPHAVVCADANSNGACDAGEATATTDAHGGFILKNAGRSPLVAEIAAGSAHSGHPVGRRLVFRAAVDPLMRAPVVVSPLTTEIVRMMEAGAPDYQTARQTLAARLDVAPEDVVKDPAAVTDPRVRQSLLRESVILRNRFALAAKMADRHEMTIEDAQQAVMNLEDIPRYDHLFIIMPASSPTRAPRFGTRSTRCRRFKSRTTAFIRTAASTTCTRATRSAAS